MCSRQWYYNYSWKWGGHYKETEGRTKMTKTSIQYRINKLGSGPKFRQTKKGAESLARKIRNQGLNNKVEVYETWFDENDTFQQELILVVQ